MTTKANEEFLAHYGAKGMKWGVRRKRGADGKVGGSPAAKRPEAKKPEEAAAVVSKNSTRLMTRREKRQAQTKTKNRKIGELTDDELKAKVDRLNLEKQYAALVNPPPVSKPVAAKQAKQEGEVKKFVKKAAMGVAMTQLQKRMNARIDLRYPTVAVAAKAAKDALDDEDKDED